MKKEEVFENELRQISNLDYRESAKKLLSIVPDYFYEIPAASTGKYHPNYAQGEGGLVRHTKAAFTIGSEILSLDGMNNFYTAKEKDLMLIGILLHDTLKCGKVHERYTRFDHPLLAASFIEENKKITSFTNDDIAFLKKVISSHMGQWNTSSYSDIELPQPKDKYEMFVHVCDYLASRKFIELTFLKDMLVKM